MQPRSTLALLEKLRSSERGLDSAEALRRLTETRPNIPAAARQDGWRSFAQ